MIEPKTDWRIIAAFYVFIFGPGVVFVIAREIWERWGYNLAKCVLCIVSGGWWKRD